MVWDIVYKGALAVQCLFSFIMEMDITAAAAIQMESTAHQQDEVIKSKETEADAVDSDAQTLKQQGQEKTKGAAGDVHNGECWLLLYRYDIITIKSNTLYQK